MVMSSGGAEILYLNRDAVKAESAESGFRAKGKGPIAPEGAYREG
jgi:hypothetical protein